MKILVNGSSLSAQPDTWPYQLQKRLSCDMINLSMPGCGNDYVHDTTISQVALNSYDLVLIMWPMVPTRTDWAIDTVPLLMDNTDSNGFVSEWYAANLVPESSRHHIERNWIFGMSHIIDQHQQTPPERRSAVSNIFSEYYQHVRAPQLFRTSLLRTITLQNTLKQMAVPFVFMLNCQFDRLPRFAHINSLIDWDCYYTDQHLSDYAKQHGLIDPSDPLHVLEQAHIEFADLLIEHLRDRNYV